MKNNLFEMSVSNIVVVVPFSATFRPTLQPAVPYHAPRTTVQSPVSGVFISDIELDVITDHVASSIEGRQTLGQNAFWYTLIRPVTVELAVRNTWYILAPCATDGRSTVHMQGHHRE